MVRFEGNMYLTRSVKRMTSRSPNKPYFASGRRGALPSLDGLSLGDRVKGLGRFGVIFGVVLDVGYNPGDGGCRPPLPAAFV